MDESIGRNGSLLSCLVKSQDSEDCNSILLILTDQVYVDLSQSITEILL